MVSLDKVGDLTVEGIENLGVPVVLDAGPDSLDAMTILGQQGSILIRDLTLRGGFQYTLRVDLGDVADHELQLTALYILNPGSLWIK